MRVISVILKRYSHGYAVLAIQYLGFNNVCLRLHVCVRIFNEDTVVLKLHTLNRIILKQGKVVALIFLDSQVVSKDCVILLADTSEI